jgi:hypothetical protein
MPPLTQRHLPPTHYPQHPTIADKSKPNTTSKASAAASPPTPLYTTCNVSSAKQAPLPSPHLHPGPQARSASRHISGPPQQCPNTHLFLPTPQHFRQLPLQRTTPKTPQMPMPRTLLWMPPPQALPPLRPQRRAPTHLHCRCRCRHCKDDCHSFCRCHSVEGGKSCRDCRISRSKAMPWRDRGVGSWWW